MPTDRTTVRLMASEKRVRTYLAGELVVDTIDPLLVWNLPRMLNYFIPEKDVRAGVLVPSDHTAATTSEGAARYFDVVVGDRVATNGACQYPDAEHEQLRDRVHLDWDAMDGWFEEDQQIFFRPPDPFHRVDVRPSSRRIEVKIDGVTVADSAHSRICFETNSPSRYYLPLVDVRMDLLKPTETSTRCPYKGVASYWSVDVDGKIHDDVVWSYKNPFFESMALSGYVAFYNEKLDIYVDGVLDPRSAART